MSARGLVFIAAAFTLLSVAAGPAAAAPQPRRNDPADATCTMPIAKQWSRHATSSMLLCVYAPYPPAVFVIDRAGKSIDGVGAQDLKPGDMVQSPACGPYPDVRAEILDAGRVIELRCGDPALAIDARAADTPPAWRTIIDAFWSAIGRIEGDTYTEKHLAAQSRGGSTRMLQCEVFSVPQIAAPQGVLYIPVDGGKAPFAASLSFRGRRAVLRRARNEQPELALNVQGLPLGNYDLYFKDGEGEAVHGTLKIVKALPVPSTAEAKAYTAFFTEPSMRAVWYGTWLYTKDDAYQLAAYQAIRPFQNTYAPAQLLAERLRGDI